MKKLIIAGGSPSTIFGVAGFCLRTQITPEQINSGEVGVIFTQAFQVGEGSPARQAVENLPADGEVAVIGLPVNNRKPEMTENLFRAIGDRLEGVYDEHEPEKWVEFREKLELPSWKFHCPQGGKGLYGGLMSAASIVGNTVGSTTEWVEAGDFLDHRYLRVPERSRALALDVDRAVNARIADNEFRVTALFHLLDNDEASEAFRARLDEGRVVERATVECLKAAELRNNILVISLSEGTEINYTAAMFAGYERAPFVVIVDKRADETVVAIGYDVISGLGQIDLLEILAELSPSGIPSKATILGQENFDRVVEILNSL